MPILLVSGKFIFLDKVFFDPAICSMEVMPNLCHDFFLIVLPLGYFIKILPKNIFLKETLRTLLLRRNSLI